MTPLRGLLAHLHARFHEARIAFVVGGSFALAARGYPRATSDIDLMVLGGGPQGVQRALMTPFPEAPRLEQVNEVTFKDERTGLIVDVIAVEDEAQRFVFDTATPALLDGSRPVRVLTAEGCCIMLLREATHGTPERRPQRLRDIEALALLRELDWGLIAEWARRMGYEEAYGELRAQGKPPVCGG